MIVWEHNGFCGGVLSLNVIETLEHNDISAEILTPPVLLVSIPVQFETVMFGGNEIVARDTGEEGPVIF